MALLRMETVYLHLKEILHLRRTNAITQMMTALLKPKRRKEIRVLNNPVLQVVQTLLRQERFQNRFCHGDHLGDENLTGLPPSTMLADDWVDSWN